MSNKIEPGLPEKLEFFNHGTYIEIVRKWFNKSIIFLTFFIMFWDGFLFFWYWTLLQNPMDSIDTMALIFPVLHVAVGIWLTYSVITGWVNRTHVLVSRNKIAIQHKPIPAFGSKEINAMDIKQIYAKEIVKHTRKSTSTAYAVQAITHSGKTIDLIDRLDNTEQALYIEQEIEKYLRIKDQPVKGEIGNQ